MSVGSSNRHLRRSGRMAALLLVVLVLDFAAGTLLLDDATPTAMRFDAAPAARYDFERVVRIVNDGESARYEYRDGLWRLSALVSGLVNVDAAGIRRTTGNRSGGLRVAFVGGSAAFGFGQGDDHTIASELATELNTGSTPVEVVNLGTPTWMLSDAAVDLRARLAAGERFDVVVSYAGFNELLMGAVGRKVPQTMMDFIVERQGLPSQSVIDHWADRSVLARLSGRQPRPPVSPFRVAAASITGIVASASVAPNGRQELVGFNYDQGVHALEDLAVEYGFELLNVVQPMALDTDSRFVSSLRAALVRGEVLDLVGTAPQDCYYDVVHTTEACSRAIALPIAAALRSRGMVASD